MTSETQPRTLRQSPTKPAEPEQLERDHRPAEQIAQMDRELAELQAADQEARPWR
jgi:hypothetical protein